MIPARLRTDTDPLFIPVHGPDADVDSPGKQPVEGTRRGQRFHADDWRLAAWVEAGGNVGRVLDDDLLALDVDHGRLACIADALLPPTFAIRTGGGGEHRFYRCPGYGRNTQLRDDLGSVRSDGWMVVVPPSWHPSGGRYRVLRDHPVASVGADDVASVVRAANATVGAAEASDGEHGECDSRPRLSGTDDLDDLIHHDHRREEVRAVLHDPIAGHARRVWLAGFLHGAVGLSPAEIVGVIDRHNRWRNYDRAETARQVRSVVESSKGRSR